MDFEQFVQSPAQLVRHHVLEDQMTLYVRKAVMVPGGYVIADAQGTGEGDLALKDFLCGQQRRHPDRALGIEIPDENMIGYLMRQWHWHLLHKPHEEQAPFFGNSAWRDQDRRFQQ